MSFLMSLVSTLLGLRLSSWLIAYYSQEFGLGIDMRQELTLCRDGIVAALDSGKVLVGAMKETYDKVRLVAEEFVEEHPILTAMIVTVIAIGILAVLVPWAVEALGFGELGPIEGKLFSIIYLVPRGNC